MTYHFDLIVIGGGSGGVRTARFAANRGKKVAIIEKSRWGGTCVIRGCVPKKMMVNASSFAKEFDLARDYGWSIGQTEFSWDAFLKARNKEIARLEGIYQNLLKNSGVTVIEGQGKITAPHTVTVHNHQGDTETFTAQDILIAVGGKPFIPDEDKFKTAWTSDQVMEGDYPLPKSAVIYGAGYIGLEIACSLKALGVDVVVAYRKGLMRGFDDGLTAWAKKQMEDKGIVFASGTILDDLNPARDGSLTLNGQRYDRLILAIGRTPVTDELGLQSVGAERKKDGTIIVDDYSKTTANHVWAVGDVTGRMNLTPVALYEGMCLVETLYGEKPVKPEYDNIPTAVFSQPELASVGLTEEQVTALGKPILVYETDFKPLKYTLGSTVNRFFAKMFVDKATNKVLGVHVGGDNAGDIIQGVAIAVKAGLTKDDFDKTIGIHPTSAEELVTLRSVSRVIGQ